MPPLLHSSIDPAQQFQLGVGSFLDPRQTKYSLKYFVAMATHEDNFDAYNSRYHDWNSVRVGPQRDIIGDWAKAARAHGLTPRARIVSTALSGADPTIMLTGPMPAARKALAKAGLTIDQIDLFEVNEAFAAVVMRFMKEMKVPHDKVNVNGGAIAMGHPLGATGAMILGTLIDELHRRKLRYGMATLCVGGGMGIATIVERI
mgnify:CR=1 FL=1